MNEWMCEKQNENDCGMAWEVIAMKKAVRISRFARLNVGVTDQPTEQLINRDMNS